MPVTNIVRRKRSRRNEVNKFHCTRDFPWITGRGISRCKQTYREGYSNTIARSRFRPKFERPDDISHQLTDRLRQHACANATVCVSPPLSISGFPSISLSLSHRLTLSRCGVATTASLRRLVRKYLQLIRPGCPLHLRAEL